MTVYSFLLRIFASLNNIEAIDLIEGRPEYLRFSALTYLGGWMYERLVNTIPLLHRFRILLVAELRKA